MAGRARVVEEALALSLRLMDWVRRAGGKKQSRL